MQALGGKAGLAGAETSAPVGGRHQAPRRGRTGDRRVTEGRLWGGWLLLVVLAVQMVLSLRLVRADTAFVDEATYLWAGHLQWAHWLHNVPLPPFPEYFSGAPVIYPPLAALADSIGGLTGARLLSLAFMLGATALLWGAAARLYGRRAAFFAAALFAAGGPVLHLGAFATYDALSVLLVAMAAWCVIRAGDDGDATGWMVTAGVALVLANATAYSSAVVDPVVLAVAVLAALPAGGRAAARRVAVLLIVMVAMAAAGLLAGGSAYLAGIGRTTVARVGGADSPLSVLGDAWAWTGVVAVLALCGVVIAVAGRAGRARAWLLAVLAFAAALGPLEQARLHTTASLDKHLVAGAWFAAIAAGYAVDRFAAAAPAGRAQALTTGACLVALVFPATLGAGQSRALATSWPNASAFIAIFRPLAGQSSGHLLVEDASIPRYYLPSGSQWKLWSSTRNIVLPSGGSTGGPASAAGVVGAGNAGVFAEFITRGYFSYVALNFADTTALDHQIANDLHRSPHYHVIDVIPYGPSPGTFVVWRYEPAP